jgi:hypothetical protein
MVGDETVPFGLVFDLYTVRDLELVATSGHLLLNYHDFCFKIRI